MTKLIFFRWLVLLQLAMLVACGGGGSSPDTAAPVSAKQRQDLGLLAQPEVVVSSTANANASEPIVGLGALADGGDIVVWVTRSTLNPVAPSPLSAQRQDASGAAVGEPVRLPGLYDPSNVAVLVRPDGELVVVHGAIRQPSSSEPGVTTTGIYLQRFASDGTPIGGEVTLVEQTRSDFPRVATTYSSPAVAQWQNGSWVVAWEFVQSTPLGALVEVQTLRFDANGQPVGTPTTIATTNAVGFSLTAVEPDQLLISVQRLAQDRTRNVFFVSDFRGLPTADVEAGLPVGSFVLPLSNGEAVLFTDTYSQRINRSGNLVGQQNPLTSLPNTAVALPDGGYVLVQAVPDGEQRIAQRYDRHGSPVGDPVLLSTSEPDIRAIVLEDGTVLLAWSEVGTDSSRVVKQRLVPA